MSDQCLGGAMQAIFVMAVDKEVLNDSVVGPVPSWS